MQAAGHLGSCSRLCGLGSYLRWYKVVPPGCKPQPCALRRHIAGRRLGQETWAQRASCRSSSCLCSPSSCSWLLRVVRAFVRQTAGRLCGIEERGRDVLHERGVPAAVHAAEHPRAGAGRARGPPRRAREQRLPPAAGAPACHLFCFILRISFRSPFLDYFFRFLHPAFERVGSSQS